MKIVKESLNEDLEMDQYMNAEVNKVNEISSSEEMRKYIFRVTNGYHFPFNPIDPLRTACREKISELLKTTINEEDTTFLSSMLEMLKGEWKSIDIPPGAMH